MNRLIKINNLNNLFSLLNKYESIYNSALYGGSVVKKQKDIVSLMKHPKLTEYLEKTNQSLNPDIKIPLGILLVVLHNYLNEDDTGIMMRDFKYDSGVHLLSDINEIVDKKDFIKYIKHENIEKITSDTLFPYSLILGPTMFKNYVNSKF